MWEVAAILDDAAMGAVTCLVYYILCPKYASLLKYNERNMLALFIFHSYLYT